MTYQGFKQGTALLHDRSTDRFDAGRIEQGRSFRVEFSSDLKRLAKLERDAMSLEWGI